MKQLSTSIQMMQYQQNETSSSEDEKPLVHPKAYWSHHEQGTERYKKEFPGKCWPMKHFRNFTLHQSMNESIRLQ